jgi:hypothetical protein
MRRGGCRGPSSVASVPPPAIGRLRRCRRRSRIATLWPRCINGSSRRRGSSNIRASGAGPSLRRPAPPSTAVPGPATPRPRAVKHTAAAQKHGQGSRGVPATTQCNACCVRMAASISPAVAPGTANVSGRLRCVGFPDAYASFGTGGRDGCSAIPDGRASPGAFVDLRGVTPRPACLDPDPAVGYPAGNLLATCWPMRCRAGGGGSRPTSSCPERARNSLDSRRSQVAP